MTTFIIIIIIIIILVLCLYLNNQSKKQKELKEKQELEQKRFIEQRAELERKKQIEDAYKQKTIIEKQELEKKRLIEQRAELERKKQIESSKLDNYSKNDSFENFIERFSTMAMPEKMQIAMQTDLINNQGADAYESGNIELAIDKFQQALKIMPINDDALINLCKCFTRIGKYEKTIDPLKKLYYLNPNTKNKIIAYSLLMHLLDDFDSDGGAVSPSTLISFIKMNFNITTNDNEIKNIMQIINEPYNRHILVYMIGFGFGMDSGESPYMTSDGTTKSVIHDEIKDVLNWN